MLSSTHFNALVLSILLLPSSARVIWVAEDFDPLAGPSLLTPRDAAVCGGDKTLHPCGGAMPSDFCCSAGTTCLALNTDASVTAAICCPAGQNCVTINPISCDTGAQNLTNTQLHAHPPQQLATCGGACCPMGYNCKDNQCVAKTAPTPASKTTSTSTSTSTHPSTSAGSHATTAAASSTTPQKDRPLGDPNADGNPTAFNGKSFAAGFVPGLAIGAIVAACLILLYLRKKRSDSEYNVDEKRAHRDTLTDLGTMDRRPPTHGRSISEPQADPSVGHRTDFLRYTPPRSEEGYDTDARPPVTPAGGPPKIRALFSRSPFMGPTPSTPRSSQAPGLSNPKRGTLSFKISPVRALKKQKSTNSLRRQMNEARNSRLRPQADLSRSGSTETIQVLMPSNEPFTPSRAAPMSESSATLGSATYQAPKSSTSTWNSVSASAGETPDARQQATSQGPYASSSRYPSEIPHMTPTRPPVPRLPNQSTNVEPFRFLGSPYTPTKEAGGGRNKGGLAPPVNDTRRDTTFSAMMERAGLRKSDLLMGPRPKQ